MSRLQMKMKPISGVCQGISDHSWVFASLLDFILGECLSCMAHTKCGVRCANEVWNHRCIADDLLLFASKIDDVVRPAEPCLETLYNDGDSEANSTKLMWATNDETLHTTAGIKAPPRCARCATTRADDAAIPWLGTLLALQRDQYMATLCWRSCIDWHHFRTHKRTLMSVKVPSDSKTICF